MGRDKATLPYLGGTLLEYVLKVVKQRCAPVFVIAAPGQHLPSVDAEVLRDDVRGVGPLVATGRGLRAAAEAGLPWAFVCAVDMPFLDPVLIDVLVDASAEPDRRRGVAVGRPRPVSGRAVPDLARRPHQRPGGRGRAQHDRVGEFR